MSSHLANISAVCSDVPRNFLSTLLFTSLNIVLLSTYCSSKRFEQFKEFPLFASADQEKLLKHCPTRWLSLRCIQRVVNQFDALVSYLGAHSDSDKPRSKVGVILSLLRDLLTLPWLHFLDYALEPYYLFNLKIQVK